MIRHRPHVATRSLGPQSFKNVGEPVEVYAVGSAVEEVGEPAHFGWTGAAKVVGGLVAFVAFVGELAESLDHHPDIDVRYNKVTLSLSTHSAGGLTDKDFELADLVDHRV